MNEGCRVSGSETRMTWFAQEAQADRVETPGVTSGKGLVIQSTLGRA
jgi:hypothetical protein